MMLKQFDLDNYLFGVDVDRVSPKEQRLISAKIRREMAEIFYGRSIARGMKLSPAGGCWAPVGPSGEARWVLPARAGH